MNKLDCEENYLESKYSIISLPISKPEYIKFDEFTKIEAEWNTIRLSFETNVNIYIEKLMQKSYKEKIDEFVHRIGKDRIKFSGYGSYLKLTYNQSISGSAIPETYFQNLDRIYQIQELLK
jgi:hypothetical protein